NGGSTRGIVFLFFFQAEDGIRDGHVTGVQTCALPICSRLAPVPGRRAPAARPARPRAGQPQSRQREARDAAPAPPRGVGGWPLRRPRRAMTVAGSAPQRRQSPPTTPTRAPGRDNAS